MGINTGEPGHWTAKRLKAQAMIESGGDKSAFLSDPLQVNVAGDWVPRKNTLLGLRKGQTMTPTLSASAGLKWLRYKGSIHNAQGKVTSYRGVSSALERYNMNKAIHNRPQYLDHHPNEAHYKWYSRTILDLEGRM